MEPIRDQELLTALEGLRPTPRPAFAAELDARVAAGFPRRSRVRAFSSAAAIDRLRALKPRQVLLPVGAVALSAIAVAAVVVSSSDTVFLSGRDATRSGVAQEVTTMEARGAETQVSPSSAPATGAAEGLSGTTQDSAKEPNFDSSGGYVRGSVNLSKRQVERTAEMTLGTDPENVGKVSSQVFGVVHANRGIVLQSSTRQSAGNGAAAQFHLLIPSAKLGDALAGFSELAEVRARREATADITAPTVNTAEQLEDSQARVGSLLAQLADAETEGEREAVEAELHTERNRSAALRTQLQRLERRADYSHLWLRVETGEPGASTDEGGGSWGVGDALDDAGRILAVGAAVALVALAILGPIALIALLVWLARRTYLRRARHGALG